MNRFMSQPFASVIVTGLVLTGILGSMIFDRVRLLATGREIVLPIKPVDPRDIFRGDYTSLAYDISTIDPSLVTQALQDYPRRASIYVTIEKGADGAWRPVAVTKDLPKGLPETQVALAATLSGGGSQSVLYGLERYYVPEGKGGELEKLAREKTLSALIAVDTHGQAAIKALLHDGKRVYAEPLW